MSEQDEAASVERVERAVRELLEGRSPRVGPADATDRDAILAAVRLAGAREHYPRMSPAFRRRLAAGLGASQESGVSRRAALVAGLAAAAGLAGGAVLGRGGLLGGGALPHAASQSLPTPPPSNPFGPAPTVQPAAATARWFAAGPLASLPDGQAVLFRAGSVAAYLLRSGPDVRGLSAICTHLPCELGWQRAERQLVCPCHPRAFDEHGDSVATGAEYPLPSLPKVMVRVTNDGIVEVLGA